MSEVEVHENDVNLLMSSQEARVLMTVLGRLSNNNAGPLADIHQQLINAGIEGYTDLHLVVEDPVLSIYVRNEDAAVSSD